MIWFHKIRLRFRALFQKAKLDAQMDDEMRSHIEMQTQENIEAGMTPEKARYAALRQFGWVESIKHSCREQRGVGWIENLIEDVRYGTRMLRKNPGFTGVAVLPDVGNCCQHHDLQLRQHAVVPSTVRREARRTLANLEVQAQGFRNQTVRSLEPP